MVFKTNGGNYKMANITLENSLLEGNYILGGLVQVNDGVIKDNPFSKSIGTSLAANWLLENESIAKNKIKQIMKTQQLGIHEADECFDFALYYFLEKEERDYNKDYFGDEASETYSIRVYCLKKLELIVYVYRNEMRRRLDMTVHLVDMDKDDSESMPKRCISYDVLNKASFEDEVDTYGYKEVIEYDELQEIFDIELPMYNEEFRMLGMVNFDIRDFVYHLFLDDNGFSLDGNNLSEEDLNRVSANMGLTPSGLQKTIELVTDNNKSKRGMFKDLPGIVMRLFKGKLKGWTPVY